MGNSNEMARAMAAGLHAPQFASMAQAAQGLVGGINAGVAQVDKRNKDMQRYEANQYVSGLLGEATPENYEANLMKAGAMSPYASPELIKQADTARAMFQRKEDKSYQANRDIIGDAFKTGEFIQRGDQFDKNYALAVNTADRNYQVEMARLAEMRRHNVSSEGLQAQELKVRKQQQKLENTWKQWGIIKELESAGYQIDSKTKMPVFTGKPTPYQSALRTTIGQSIIMPTDTRNAYNDKNLFGGIFALDSTTDIPTMKANELMQAGHIHPSEKNALIGLISTDPDKANALLETTAAKYGYKFK